MFYAEKESLLLATGLSLTQIAEIICDSPKEKTIEERLQTKSKKYLDRYLIIKEYKELTKNEKVVEAIVPVIGGLPCTGKTTIARELGVRLGFGTIISGDTVRESLRELVSEAEHPEFFTSVYDSWKFFGNEPTKENVIAGYRKQAEIISRVMQKIMWRAAIKDGENMAIEYLHFLPELIDKEILEHPSIIPIVLAVPDVELHKTNVRKRTYFHMKGGWQRLLDNLPQYRIMHDYQTAQAKKYGIPVIEYLGNTDEVIEQVLDIVFERIKKLNKTSGKK
ncbi:MAG: hypothetical protein ABH803_02750 [Candidatus Micrarchaeota archaeon]